MRLPCGRDLTIGYEGGSVPARINCLGEHNIANALIAFTVGKLLDIEPEKMAEAIGEFKPQGIRHNIRSVRGMTFIVDCYNAGPESMHASFQVVKAMKAAGKKIAVLGTMRELGERAPGYHRAAGLEAAEIFDRVITLGEGSPWYKEGAPNAAEAPGVEDVAPMLLEIAAPGDLILFKGSRLNYLEKAADAFEKAVTPRP